MQNASLSSENAFKQLRRLFKHTGEAVGTFGSRAHAVKSSRENRNVFMGPVASQSREYMEPWPLNPIEWLDSTGQNTYSYAGL